jgi:hypothetical protein
MKIDVTLYKALIPYANSFVERKRGYFTEKQIASQFAQATHCPQIVADYIIADLMGMTEELQRNIDACIKFYGYTEVIR